MRNILKLFKIILLTSLFLLITYKAKILLNNNDEDIIQNHSQIITSQDKKTTDELIGPQKELTNVKKGKIEEIIKYEKENNYIYFSAIEPLHDNQIKDCNNNFNCIYEYLSEKSNQMLGDYLNNSISEDKFDLYTLKYDAIYRALLSERSKILYKENQNNYEVIIDFYSYFEPLPHMYLSKDLW